MMMNYMHNSTNDRLNRLQNSYARASHEYSKAYDNKSYKVGDTTANSSLLMKQESEGYNPHGFSFNNDLSSPVEGRRYSPLRNSRSRSGEREEHHTFRLRP